MSLADRLGWLIDRALLAILRRIWAVTMGLLCHGVKDRERRNPLIHGPRREVLASVRQAWGRGELPDDFWQRAADARVRLHAVATTR